VKTKLVNAIGPIAVFLVFISLWYIVAYSLHNNFSPASGKPMIIPPPHRLFEDFNGPIRDRIFTALLISTRTAFTGLALSAFLGIIIGIAMSQAKWIERSLWPHLIALQVTPIIAISIFPIVSNTLFGIQSVHPSLHDLFRLQNSSRWVILRKLQIPAASPAIFTGLRVAAGLAVIGAIVGDFFFTKGDPGLGQLITFFFLNNLSGPMFITALFATGLGLMLFVCFGVLNRIVIGRWHESAAR
jgi:NitT/TauT family transport system permease protein